jgi:exodeoxyribonuclease VII large subunit
MALQTSPEQPVPVRVLSQHIGAWVHRLGSIWVEGQVAQLTRRPGARTAFVVLRDPAAQVSVQMTCPADVIAAASPPITEGARLVVHGKPSWWFERGTLSLAVDEVRPVGIGVLLARIEHLRRTLAAEGLFDEERRRPLPFVPRRIGLICGRASAAERDVLSNAHARAPGIEFQVENVPVQGPAAVSEIVAALDRLDRDDGIDVIILARGGGSVEDLLPFSDEHLVRAVAAARTPVVAAIGHETDTPLVDHVADVRASTPTDAAKRVVPDVSEERRRVTEARRRLGARLHAVLTHERTWVVGVRSRPALREPRTALVEPRRHQLIQDRRQTRAALARLVDTERLRLGHARAQVQALSPAATLDRGYAIVQRLDGTVVRSPTDTAVGQVLRLRLAAGQLHAVVVDEKDAS